MACSGLKGWVDLMPKLSPYIKIKAIYGEKTRVLAKRLGLNDPQLEIHRFRDFVYLPIIRRPKEDETAVLRRQTPDFVIGIRVFHERKQRGRTVTDALGKTFPPNLLAVLPRALDVVGDIAVIEVPAELKPHRKTIGEAILETHKNVHTVLAKASAVSGTYRLRKFEVIAGQNRTTTIHKEFGCQYHVDLEKAFFSPRLSHEHQRVASLVEDGEAVVDLFAGVGPFSVLIANKKDAKVFAVEINPEAFELLRKNILLNRVQHRVTPILGDAKQIVLDRLSGLADRVIMNLPETSDEFIDVACRALKPTGGVIHFYSFVRLPDSIVAMKVRFAERVKESGRAVKQFPSARTVRETAPYQWHVALDAMIV